MERYIVYMENNTELIQISSAMLPIVADCDILTASDNFYHMDRTADFNVMIYVTDGTMYVTENGIDHEISAGELFFLKSGLRHYGKRETPRGTRWFYAHFFLNDISDSCEHLILPKKLSGLSESSTEEKIYRLCEEFHSSDPLKSFRANAMFYELLLNTASEKQPEYKTVTDKICAYLDDHTDRPFTKELVEKSFFLSYSYLAAEFRKEKGISMGQYHNTARMKKACRLLRSTLLSVGEIADKLGFSDMLYFSRKFHSFTGISPTDYRKQIQNKY